jgi:hypothetical protein
MNHSTTRFSCLKPLIGCISLLPLLAFAGCATPLTTAAREGNTEKIKALLASGADINDRGIQGWPPLMAAAEKGQLAAVKVFIENGADIEARAVGNSGMGTPLSQAARSGHCDVVQYLLENGANIGPEDISLAVPDCARLLLKWKENRKHPQQVAQDPAPPASRSKLETAMPDLTVAEKKPEASAVVQSDADKPQYSRPEHPDDFALVIGIEKYSNLPDAEFAERDAAAVRRHLIALGYPEANIIGLIGSKATRTAFAKNIESWLPLNVNENSTVFVYYSGHGAPDAKTGQAYLVPWDGDPEYLEGSAYPLKRLYEKLNALKAKRVIVALDSCFSGAGGRSVLAKGTRPLVTQMDMGAVEPGKIVALTASNGDQISGTIDDQSHGAFTYYLLKGLNGAAADDSNHVTLRSLYDYLKPKVSASAHRHNREQTPQLLPAGEPAALLLR